MISALHKFLCFLTLHHYFCNIIRLSVGYQNKSLCFIDYQCGNVYFQGDLRKHLNKKGALEPLYAVKLALDIARFATHHIPHITGTLLLLFFLLL